MRKELLKVLLQSDGNQRSYLKINFEGVYISSPAKYATNFFFIATKQVYDSQAPTTVAFVPAALRLGAVSEKWTQVKHVALVCCGHAAASGRWGRLLWAG